MIWWPLEIPTLQSGAVTLRPLEERDIDSVFDACQDPLIPQFTRVVSPYTRELAVDFVRSSPFTFTERRAIQFAIEYGVGDSKNFAGAMSLHSINLSDHCAELGYWMTPGFRGKGVCSVAARLLAEFALETIGFQRIEALVDTENIASEKVLLSAGFLFEGTLHKKVTRPDGTQKDMKIFAVTQS